MDESNDGAKRGTISHLILECLQHLKRRERIQKYIDSGFAGNPSIKRLVLKHAKILGVDDKANMKLIESFIKVGLETDFLCEGWDLKEPEKKFQIENENPEYKILGFIDKHAVSFDGSQCRIDDYKTSKRKFAGEDSIFNIQAYVYALAMWKEGGYKESFVNFIFLKFPKSPLQSFKFDEKVLKGFEHYLGDIYRYLKSFTVKKACSNFAKNNKSFFLCGKEAGDLNAKGKPDWVCPWKKPFLYWEIKDANGKIKFTSKTEQKALDKMSEGDILSEKYFPGCVIWNKN